MKPLLFTLLIIAAISCKKDAIQSQNPNDPDPVDTPSLKGLAVLHTDPVSDLTRYSVKVTGKIVDTGSSTVTQAGFVVDTISAATLDRNLNVFTRPISAHGELLVIIQDIPASKKYYLRAYAKNGAGVAYGNEVSFTALDEKVYSGTALFTTQEEVASFAANHYTKIDGSLVITGTVNDLTPLRDLVVINYALNINETQQLKTLAGLENIEGTNVKGFHRGIEIMRNQSLETTEGLQGLVDNDGYFTILGNPKLQSLEGLRNLQFSFYGDMRIEDCDKLVNLEGLNRLALVNGFFYIRMNDQLTDLSALNALTSVTDCIHIEGNPELVSINGFESITFLPNVHLRDNQKLNDLSGFRNATKMWGLLLDSNKMSNLAGLANVSWFNYLHIDNSSSLTDLSALSNVTSLTTLFINRTGLKNLHGLEKITNLYQLEISWNQELESLSGIDNLASVTGEMGSKMWITRNPRLLSLDALNHLTQSNANIQVNANDVLGEFCGLKPLFTANNPAMTFSTEMNAINPSKEDILANCP